MLVAAFDLERLSSLCMNTINDKNNMVSVSFKIMNREMPRNVICIAVSFQSKEFSGNIFGSVGVRCVHVLLLLLLLLLWSFDIVLRCLLLFLVKPSLTSSDSKEFLPFFLVYECNTLFTSNRRKVLFILEIDL